MRIADLDARPATLDDAAAVADLATALDPDDPTDPVIQRWRWMTAPPWPRERFLLERDGQAVGLAYHSHPPWDRMPERYADVGALLHPAVSTELRLQSAYDEMEDRARREGALAFSTWRRASEADHVGALLRRGYREERRGKLWQLDLVAHRAALERMAAESRERMRREAIRVLTLAEDGDAEAERKLWAVAIESFQDVPTTVPIVLPPFEQWRKWLDRPDVHRDRVWIARNDDGVVGMSALSYPPVRGNVWTTYTGTARSVRGRGAARALKLETVLQAIALGVRRVRTGNDGENAPILHLNEQMGYDHYETGVQLLKRA